MASSILTAHASKHGSTREVAEAIAETLVDRGLDVDVHAARDVHDLGGYAGVVLGCALYMGRPHGDARRFLKRHHKALSGLPVAVFAMGPRTSGDDDLDGAKKQLDEALAKVSDLTPISTAVFGGVVDPEKLSFPFNHMPASDARDWSSIERWARDVAELLAARLPASIDEALVRCGAGNPGSRRGSNRNESGSGPDGVDAQPADTPGHRSTAI